MNSSASIVQGAEQVNINGGTYIICRTESDLQALQGIKALAESGRISWSSLYNSDIRINEANDVDVTNAVGGWRSLLEYKTTSGPSFDHSGVDEAISAICSWVTSPAAQPLIMWVHDDDKKKTSFIAQVVAYLLAERRRLSATYFFDGHADRNSLVPTLIHGFTRRHKRGPLLTEISRAIDSNPVGVFKCNHREQLSQLLVRPLRIVSESYQADAHHQPQDNIILLHAFEDCNDEGGFQESFLDALLDALISIKNLKYPQRLLLIGRRTDHLEEFLMGKLASRSPVLQRPVQSQHLLSRDREIRRKSVELKKREDEMRRLSLVAHNKEEKIRQENRQLKEECERIMSLCSKKEQEVAKREKLVQEREKEVREREESAEEKSKALKKEVAEREKLVQGRENKVREREESAEQKSKALKKEKLEVAEREKLVQGRENKVHEREESAEQKSKALKKEKQEVAGREKLVQGRENKVHEREESAEQKSKELKKENLRLERENEGKTKGEEPCRVNNVQATGLEGVLQPIVPTSPTPSRVQSSLPTSPQESGMQENARMISPASQVTKSDRVIILMGPLVPHKSDFIDCLTRCVNPWQFSPSTKTSDQFFDSRSLGKGRFWVKAVRTRRQSHTVLFVDFPSLGDDDLGAADILNNIVTWLTEIHKNEVTKIAGILYFHPLLEPDGGPSHRNLRALGQICGTQAAKNVIFVFQELSHSTAQKAEAFFQQHYGNLMKGLGAGFDHFDNTAASGWKIVDRLLVPQSEDVSLLLQDELFVLRRSLHKTSAAKQLYGDLIARLRESGSDSTNDERDKIHAELQRLQNLQHSGPSNTREPGLLATGVNFPNLTF